MSVVWIIESASQTKQSAASVLVGNFAVRLFASYSSFRALVRIKRNAAPNVLVVDLDCCGGDGRRLEELLNLSFPGLPRIFLAQRATDHGPARVDANTWVYGKPMDPLRLTGIIESLLAEKVADSNGTHALHFHDLKLDCQKFTLEILPAGEPQALTMKETRLLRAFLQRPNTCISRDEIAAAAWDGVKVGERTVDSHISRLRRRLDGSEVTIESVYGDGYLIRGRAVIQR